MCTLCPKASPGVLEEARDQGTNAQAQILILSGSCVLGEEPEAAPPPARHAYVQTTRPVQSWGLETDPNRG